MDNCSYFIKDKALFGNYPDDDQVAYLESIGVRYFIDLTNPSENLPKYKHKSVYISYPIRDRHAPVNQREFSRFILQLCRIITTIKYKNCIYLHCRGGHGRSGVVVACILSQLFAIKADDAMEMTTRAHNERKVMREKWRRIGSPQTATQKIFVRNMFKPFYFYRAYKTGKSAGFSNFSLHPVDIPNFGKFPTAEAAFQAYKDPENKEYVERQQNAPTPADSKKWGRRCNLRADWTEVRVDIMYKILWLKFQQHPDILENLLNTGLRPLVEHSKYDSFWGDGYGDGENMLGKLLTQVRNTLHLKD